jgi:hypothetical protein
VALQPLTDKCSFLIDCELHQCNIPPRIQAYPWPRNYTAHELKSVPSEVSETAYRLYYQLLAPFSSTVALFVSDFGGLTEVVNFLVSWGRSAMTRPGWARSRVTLMFEEASVPTEKHVHFLVTTALLRKVHICEPTEPYTLSDMNKIIKSCYDISVLRAFPHKLSLQNLMSTITETSITRQQLGFEFSAIHLSYLLHAAIIHFSSNLSAPFSVYHAARINNPVPGSLREHVIDFLRFTKLDYYVSTSLVASALVMDAFPSGMHSE